MFNRSHDQPRDVIVWIEMLPVGNSANVAIGWIISSAGILLIIIFAVSILGSNKRGGD